MQPKITGTLVLCAALLTPTPGHADGCLDTQALQNLADEIRRNNASRLEGWLKKSGYHRTNLAKLVPHAAVPLGTSTATISGRPQRIFATRPAIVGAGQTIEEPVFVRDSAGELHVVNWTPRKVRNVRPRACGCYINGGGAARQIQHVYALPPNIPTVKTLKTDYPRAEQLAPRGKVCQIPQAPPRK